jgi:hypothetical protein
VTVLQGVTSVEERGRSKETSPRRRRIVLVIGTAVALLMFGLGAPLVYQPRTPSAVRSTTPVFRAVEPSETDCTLELSERYSYVCPGQATLSGAVEHTGHLLHLAGVAERALREERAVMGAIAVARAADPTVLIQARPALELPSDYRVTAMEGRLYLVPPIELATFCATRGAPHATRRIHWFVLENGSSRALPRPLMCPPELLSTEPKTAASPHD